MAFKHVLKTVLDPSVILKEMSIWDDSKERSNAKPGDPAILRDGESGQSNELIIGRDTPYIQIGKFTTSKAGTLEVVIDETEFIPTIKVVFMDDRLGFETTAFPKKHPILSIYMKSPNAKVKAIRSDYLITSLKQMDSKEWIVRGELFIPKLYQNVSNSYPNMTSREALIAVCKDLGLGFQSNDFNLDDSMTWINPNWDSYTFIKHIIRHSYIDDDQFLTGFIDKYYHLNLINVNMQLDHAGEMDKTLLASVDTAITNSMKDSNPTEDDVINNILVKYPGHNTGPTAITQIDIMTDNGDILIEDGYRKRIFYYDHLDNKDKPAKKAVDWYARAISSKDAPGELSDLEPEDEDLKTGEIRKWMNISYGNTHEHYNAATLINYHNLRELDKMLLEVSVNGINFTMTRGQRAPVMVIDPMAESIAKRTNETFETKQALNRMSQTTNMKKDEYITGFYYVKGAVYYFDNGQFRTTLHLSRRDWKPVQEEPSETNNPIV